MTYLTVPGGEIKPDQDHFKWKVWSVFSICSKTILQLVKQSVIPFHGYFRKTAEFQGTFINCKGGRGKWDFNALAGCKGQGGLHGIDQSVSLISRANSVSLRILLSRIPVNKYPRNSLARTYQFGVLDNKSLIRRFVG